MIVDVLHARAVTLPTLVQGTEQFLLFRIDAQHWHATLARESAQCRNMTELFVALLRVNRAGDQFLRRERRRKPA